jgi:hypothetical protein
VNLWTKYFAQTRMVRGGVTQAVAAQQGRGLLSLMVHNQAREMADLDPFGVFAIMALSALPLVLLMKKAVARAWGRDALTRPLPLSPIARRWHGMEALVKKSGD